MLLEERVKMMVNKKEDTSIDEILEKHINEDSYESTTVDDFGRMVTKAVNSAAKDKGYDSLTEMIKDEIAIGIDSKNKPRRPTARLSAASDSTTRYEYFMKAIDSVSYDSRYRGNYKTGHIEAVERYIDKVELNKQNLVIVDRILKQELNATSRRGNQSLYDKGYLDGLKTVERVLVQSKNAMMMRVASVLKGALR